MTKDIERRRTMMRSIIVSQGPGAGVEDHQERGQVQGGGQARGERAGEAAGERPPGEAVSLHHHHHHHQLTLILIISCK